MSKTKVKHEGQSGFIEGVGLMENGKTYEFDKERHKAYLAATSKKQEDEAARAEKAKEAIKAAQEKSGAKQSFRKNIIEKDGGKK